MHLDGIEANSTIEGEKPIGAVSHYYIGNQPSAWRSGVTHFDRIRYRNAYPGIDVVFYGKDGRLEYDVIVAPGADPNAVRLRFDGASRLSLEANGDLGRQWRAARSRCISRR